MTRWRPVLYAVGILLLGMLYMRACWEPRIRADERRRFGDRRDDSTIARLAAESFAREKAFSRERDSMSQVIGRLRARVRQTSPDVATSGGISPAAVPTRDPLIAARVVYRVDTIVSPEHTVRDSVSQVIGRLRARAGANLSPQPTPPQPRGRDTADASVGVAPSQPVEKVAPDVRDSLIASLLSGRQQDSLQILFWRAQVAQRDSLLPVLQRARDRWRRQAERRFACGAGVGVTVGLDGRSAVGPSLGCYVKL